jgi:hypothetical protein
VELFDLFKIFFLFSLVYKRTFRNLGSYLKPFFIFLHSLESIHIAVFDPFKFFFSFFIQTRTRSYYAELFMIFKNLFILLYSLKSNYNFLFLILFF